MTSGSFQFNGSPWRGAEPTHIILDELADWPVLCTCGQFICEPEHHAERVAARLTDALEDED